MERLLATSGWKAILSEGQFDLLKKQVALYSLIEHTEAWADYQHRLAQLRQATRDAIERGNIDKFGRTHEEEQRAVLFLLDQMISYLPTLKSEYTRLVDELKAEEARANRPLYGDDTLMDLTRDL